MHLSLQIGFLNAQMANLQLQELLLKTKFFTMSKEPPYSITMESRTNHTVAMHWLVHSINMRMSRAAFQQADQEFT